MKNTIVYICLLALLFSIGCKSDSDPKVVLSQFFEALSKKDMKKAKSLATQNSQQMLDLMSSDMVSENKKEDSKFNKDQLIFKDAVINGETASVEVLDKNEKNGAMTFLLKKEKGDWKVAFDKETIIGIGMKAALENGDKEKADSAIKTLTDGLKNQYNVK